jgi:hypothetical protein
MLFIGQYVFRVCVFSTLKKETKINMWHAFHWSIYNLRVEGRGETYST